MDKDRVKGAADDAAGRVERQAGEWTGDNKAQAEGAARQIKGKAEKFAGDVKDTARDANAHSKQDEESTRVHKPDEHTRRTGTHGD